MVFTQAQTRTSTKLEAFTELCHKVIPCFSLGITLKPLNLCELVFHCSMKSCMSLKTEQTRLQVERTQRRLFYRLTEIKCYKSLKNDNWISLIICFKKIEKKTQFFLQHPQVLLNTRTTTVDIFLITFLIGFSFV